MNSCESVICWMSPGGCGLCFRTTRTPELPDSTNPRLHDYGTHIFQTFNDCKARNGNIKFMSLVAQYSTQFFYFIFFFVFGGISTIVDCLGWYWESMMQPTKRLLVNRFIIANREPVSQWHRINRFSWT